MDAILLLLPLVLVLLPQLTLRRFAAWPEARFWVAGWFVLYGAGLAAASEARLPEAAVAALAALPPFGALVLAGALAFLHRPVPRLLAPLGIAGALGVAAAGVFAGLDAAALGGGALEVALVGAASGVLWRGVAPDAPQAERALAPTLAAFGALQLVAWLAAPSRPVVLAVWTGGALAVAALQTMAYVERSFRREERSRARREHLRRVALVLARERDPATALARVATEIHAFGAFPFVGIWSLAPDGTHYELLESRGEGVVHEELRRPAADHPLARAAAAAEAPLFIEALERDPRAHESGRGPGVVAPLRAGGRVVGILAGSTDPRRPLDAESRRFLDELADEVALGVAHLQRSAREGEAARALAAERERLRALLAASPVGLLLVDPDGRVQLWNSRFVEQSAGDDGGRFLARPGREIVAGLGQRLQPESRAALEDVLRRVAEDCEQALPPVEVRTRDDGGAERIVVLSSQGVRAEDGRWLGRVWVSHDVTSERRLAERLQQAGLMETLGTLAGGLAHDFNNQLTSILGNAKLLLEDVGGQPALRELVHDLEASAQHCAELTRGLLEFARQSPSQPCAVRAERAVEDVVALLRPSLPPEVSIALEVVGEVGTVRADETQLRRVVTNLLVNARDAVGERGRITVRLRPLVEDPGGAGFVVLEVMDDGAGMDAETRRRIFDPFFTTKSQGRGTGLGLAVVYGIVEAHGGAVEVESAPGRGSLFRLRWPRAGLPEPPPRRPAPPRLSGAGTTILLAEDEPGVRKLTRATLERAGYRVLEAEDGEEAVRVFLAHRGEVGLLLFDLSMPKKSGLDALAEVRRSAPGLPALVVSGHPARQRRDAWPEAVALLPKPFGPEALLASVEAAVASTARPKLRTPRGLL